MSQAPNYRTLLCRSRFESQHKKHKVKNCGKNCVSCPYLLKPSSHQFLRVNKNLLLKTLLTVKALSCCHVQNRMPKRKYSRNGLSTEKANKYLQITYKSAATLAM